MSSHAPQIHFGMTLNLLFSNNENTLELPFIRQRIAQHSRVSLGAYKFKFIPASLFFFFLPFFFNLLHSKCLAEREMLCYTLRMFHSPKSVKTQKPKSQRVSVML